MKLKPGVVPDASTRDPIGVRDIKSKKYHTRRGEYGVSRTEAPERKASKKYPQPRKGRAASNGGEGNFLE